MVIFNTLFLITPISIAGSVMLVILSFSLIKASIILISSPLLILTEPCIQFIHEGEYNNKLTFLNAFVSKNGPVFFTSVFWNVFSVSVLSHAKSNHP